VRVLIVDDALLFRQVARELLTLRGYEVVGEATDAASALAAAERLAPDAVLLDLGLDEDSGHTVSERLRQRVPPPAVLLVSADAARANGVVSKSRLADVEFHTFWPRGPGMTGFAGGISGG
jgi:DNA-binding NarL/FixJ family response regulator